MYLDISVNMRKAATDACLTNTGAFLKQLINTVSQTKIHFCKHCVQTCNTVMFFLVHKNVCFTYVYLQIYLIQAEQTGLKGTCNYWFLRCFIYFSSGKQTACLGATHSQHVFPARLMFLYSLSLSLLQNSNFSAEHNLLNLLEKIVFCFTFLQGGQRSWSITEQQARSQENSNTCF